MNELKKMKVFEIRINALRLELIGLMDALNRLLKSGTGQLDKKHLDLKLKVLAKKFELAQARTEKKLFELQLHAGSEAA